MALCHGKLLVLYCKLCGLLTQTSIFSISYRLWLNRRKAFYKHCSSDFVTNSCGESWDSSCEKSWVPVQNHWVPVQKTTSPNLKMLGPLCNQTDNLMIGLISAALLVVPRKRWLDVWVAYCVCDVNSKFNLCIVTKGRKWEMSNTCFALPLGCFGIRHKN